LGLATSNCFVNPAIEKSPQPNIQQQPQRIKHLIHMSKSPTKTNRSKMKTIKIKISDIIIGPRQRIDLGDVAGLAESIKEHGQIQAIGITDDNRLIWGRRRLEAHRILGLETIDAVQRSGLSPLDEQMLEWEEDYRQKPRGWREKCTALADMYQHMKNAKALNGETWTKEMMADFTGIGGPTHVKYMLNVAEELRARPEGEVAKADNLTGAIKTLLEIQRTQSVAEMERRRALTKAAEHQAQRIEVAKTSFVEGETQGDMFSPPSAPLTDVDRIPLFAYKRWEPNMPKARLVLMHGYDESNAVAYELDRIDPGAIVVCFTDVAFINSLPQEVVAEVPTWKAHHVPLIWYQPGPARGNKMFGLDYKMAVVFYTGENFNSETQASSIMIAPTAADGYLPLAIVSHIIEATTLNGVNVLCLGDINPIDVAMTGRTPIIIDEQTRSFDAKVAALKSHYQTNNPGCEFIL
jgi:ParB family chromosome partitioning protein